MSEHSIENVFKFHPADTQAKRDAHEGVRDHCKTLGHYLNDVLPRSAEKDEAIKRLQEAMFWANAALARYPSSVD